VRRRRWLRGGRAAVLLVALVACLTGCSVHDAEKKLRFGWPTGVTKQGTEMRVLWTWSGVAALIVGVIVWGLIFWACIRYRKKNDELPKQTKYNHVLEVVYTVIPVLIIAALFYRTVVVEDDVDKITKNPDVRVQVDAFKWNWQFEYHTYDRTKTAAYPKQQGQANTATGFLANPTDPSGKSPLYLSTVGSSTEIPVLVLPVNAHVYIDEHSDDVIHSFWVPEFLFKRDILPYGTNQTTRDNKFEIQPTSEGSFVGRCAELCGTYHSEMNFEVRVVSKQTFDTYLAALARIGPNDPARQSKALVAAGMKPYATTTEPFATKRTDSTPNGQVGGA
jgi:cytochrome c oxidase subunit II